MVASKGREGPMRLRCGRVGEEGGKKIKIQKGERKGRKTVSD